MKDNLLFVNQNKDIIREFLETVKDAEFDVDTTDNGLEAAVLLQKKKYKLVITGIDLATYDGTKIVEYVNEYCPETLCIVYTVRLELAHLKLLINERKVFRIFQRDVSYHGELQEAIIDAFTCYGKRELQAQNEQIMEKNLKNARTYLDEMKKVSAGRPGEREDFTKFAKALLEVFRREMEEALPREEAGQLIRYESGLLFWILDEKNQSVRSLEEVRQRIDEEFSRASGEPIPLDTQYCPEEANAVVCADLYFVMRMLMLRFFLVSRECRAQAKLIPINGGSFRLKMEARFPGNEWNKAHERQGARIVTAVTQTILESFVGQCRQNISDEKITYYIELKSRNVVK